MPFKFDAASLRITMATGDTANIRVEIDWTGLGEGDVLLFAVFNPDTGEDIVCKPVTIIEGAALIRICSHDTRDIKAGQYRWNMRIVTSPIYDEQGKCTVDECSDDVITVFNKAPRFELICGGGRV